MRAFYEQQLETLHHSMIRMGCLCEEGISLAVHALRERDTVLIRKVQEIEGEIDEREREIEQLCMKLLLRQQPVASDLRAISSALKMISDMERIGDQASDIAEITGQITPPPEALCEDIHTMAQEAVKMVTDSIDSYVRGDLVLARQVIAQDDTVDGWFTTVRQELIALIRSDAGQAEEAVDLLMIVKYLERIGDHATNIAEWVEFALTGVHVSH